MDCNLFMWTCYELACWACLVCLEQVWKTSVTACCYCESSSDDTVFRLVQFRANCSWRRSFFFFFSSILWNKPPSQRQTFSYFIHFQIISQISFCNSTFLHNCTFKYLSQVSVCMREREQEYIVLTEFTPILNINTLRSFEEKDRETLIIIIVVL